MNCGFTDKPPKELDHVPLNEEPKTSMNCGFTDKPPKELDHVPLNEEPKTSEPPLSIFYCDTHRKKDKGAVWECLDVVAVFVPLALVALLFTLLSSALYIFFHTILSNIWRL